MLSVCCEQQTNMTIPQARPRNRGVKHDPVGGLHLEAWDTATSRLAPRARRATPVVSCGSRQMIFSKYCVQLVCIMRSTL